MTRPHLLGIVLLASGCELDAAGLVSWEAGNVSPVHLEVVLTSEGVASDVTITVQAPDGEIVHESTCGLAAYARKHCAIDGNWFRSEGPYGLALEYVAVDGVAERVTEEVELRGDELMVEANGAFDDDASATLGLSCTRSVPPGVALRVLAPTTGAQPPGAALVNEGPYDVRVQGDFEADGFVVEVQHDGCWQAVTQLRVGCIGPFLEVVRPGERLRTNDGSYGRPRLPPGRYLLVVPVDDRVSDVLSRPPSGATALPFEISVTADDVEPPAVDDDWDVGWLLAPRLPRLPRPGRFLPPGVAGAVDEPDAPGIGEGSIIAGHLDEGSPRALYRVEVPVDTDVYLHLYARCIESPCVAAFGASLEGSYSLAALHREPPAWSTRDEELSGDGPGEHVLSLTCGDDCRSGGVEYYAQLQFTPAFDLEDAEAAEPGAAD